MMDDSYDCGGSFVFASSCVEPSRDLCVFDEYRVEGLLMGSVVPATDLEFRSAPITQGDGAAGRLQRALVRTIYRGSS